MSVLKFYYKVILYSIISNSTNANNQLLLSHTKSKQTLQVIQSLTLAFIIELLTCIQQNFWNINQQCLEIY
jgi:hypothetical protein